MYPKTSRPDGRRLAYAQDGAGSYKVQSLIGLAYDAPYLHDGGVAAGCPGGVMKDDSGCYKIKDVLIRLDGTHAAKYSLRTRARACSA